MASDKQPSKFLFHLDDFEFTGKESSSRDTNLERLQNENRELREKLKFLK
jgi:hypothetical protein